MQKLSTGLDILLSSQDHQNQIKGKIAYLGNQASVTSKLQNGLDALISVYGDRVTKAFGPQHGYSTVVQDNMIETPHDIHPFHHIPVYSLYSETRIPTESMMEGTDSLIIDLQDVGTRVYTYIWTLYLAMEYAQNKDLRIIVLDRPNPIGGLLVQGNLPDPDYFSFVCKSKIPMRHGMTIGEMALWFKKIHFPDTRLQVISMKGWNRKMLWNDTGLPWLNPSPNLPTPEGCLVYPGSVLFEGTNLSEGRGTTRSLEIFGHPDIEPNKIKKELDRFLSDSGAFGQELRPIFFEPVFHKFKGISCGGYQIHITDYKSFNPWKLGQLLISFFYRRMDPDLFWSTNPYEYEFRGLAIDWINGTDKIRKWVENKGDASELDHLEAEGNEEFLSLSKELLIYP